MREIKTSKECELINHIGKILGEKLVKTVKYYIYIKYVCIYLCIIYIIHILYIERMLYRYIK